AGAGASIPDRDFEIAGATIVATAAEIYAQAEMLLKVRALDACETAMVRPGRHRRDRPARAARAFGHRGARAARRVGVRPREAPTHHASADDGRAVVAGEHRGI